MSDSTVKFSSTELEAKPGSHVYIPDFPDDYRSIYTGKILKTIDNPNPTFETDIVNHVALPPFCTATSNPGPGSYLVVKYPARQKLIEVFTFEKYINSFIGHMMVRDVEYLTQEFAREIATALGQGVEVEAHYNLVGFKYGQGVTITVKLNDHQAQTFRQEYAAKYQKYLDEQAEKKLAKAQAAKETKANATDTVNATANANTCPVTGAKSTTTDSVDHSKCPVQAMHDAEKSQCPVSQKETAQHSCCNGNATTNSTCTKTDAASTSDQAIDRVIAELQDQNAQAESSKVANNSNYNVPASVPTDLTTATTTSNQPYVNSQFEEREPDYTKVCPVTGELGCTCPPKVDKPLEAESFAVPASVPKAK